MLASLMQLRLSCVHRVTQALKLSADQPADEQLLQLVELAQREHVLAALVAIVRERPAYLIVAKEDRNLLRVLGSIGLDWSKFAVLLPRLVAAAEEIHEFGVQCCGRPTVTRANDDAGPGVHARADRRDPD